MGRTSGQPERTRTLDRISSRNRCRTYGAGRGSQPVGRLIPALLRSILEAEEEPKVQDGADFSGAILESVIERLRASQGCGMEFQP